MKTTYKYKFSNKIKDHLKSKWWIYIVFLILFLPVLFYMINFRDQEISDKTSDWGDFGSYIGGWYSAIIAFLAIVISWKLNEMNSFENKIGRGIDRITLSYYKIRDLYETVEKNNEDIDKVQKCRKLIMTECRIIDYYIKTFPIKVDNLNDFRNSIYNMRRHVTNKKSFDEFEKEYFIFIQNQPEKINIHE